MFDGSSLSTCIMPSTLMVTVNSSPSSFFTRLCTTTQGASPWPQDVAWQWHNVLGAVIACAATAAYFYCSPRHQAHSSSGPRTVHVHAGTVPQSAEKRGLRHYTHAHGYISTPESDVSAVKKQAQLDGGFGAHSPHSGGDAAGGPFSSPHVGWVARFWDAWLGSPSQRGRLANALILTVLLASPLELVQGAVWRRALPGWAGGQKHQVANFGKAVLASVEGTHQSPASVSGGVFVAGVHGSAWSPFLLAAAQRRAAAGLVACSDVGTPAQHKRLGGVATKPDGIRAAKGDQAGNAMEGGAVEGGAGVMQAGAGVQMGAAGAVTARALQGTEQQVVEGMHARKHRARENTGASLSQLAEGGGLKEGLRQMWMGDGDERPAVRLPPPSATAILGIYTGWLGKGNLGDEVVADIFFDLLVAAVGAWVVCCCHHRSMIVSGRVVSRACICLCACETAFCADLLYDITSPMDCVSAFICPSCSFCVIQVCMTVFAWCVHVHAGSGGHPSNYECHT